MSCEAIIFKLSFFFGGPVVVVLPETWARLASGTFPKSLGWSRPFWDPILVGIGEFTTHFRTYFSGWIG